jgi:hypothetical protein
MVYGIWKVGTYNVKRRGWKQEKFQARSTLAPYLQVSAHIFTRLSLQSFVTSILVSASSRGEPMCLFVWRVCLCVWTDACAGKKVWWRDRTGRRGSGADTHVESTLRHTD